MLPPKQREKLEEKTDSEEKRGGNVPPVKREWTAWITSERSQTNNGKRCLCHNGRHGVVIELVGLHMAVQLRLGNITLFITPRSLPRLVAVGELAHEGLAVGVHAQLVNLQIRPPHEGLFAARYVALVLLVDLRSTRISACT